MSLENPCTFCLQKKIPENAFLTLTVNYHKIVQIMSFKTTLNWLFNEIWCYLVISSLIGKLAFFNKQLQWVYYALNCTSNCKCSMILNSVNSSIVYEVIATVFFIKHILNLKYTKQ